MHKISDPFIEFLYMYIHICVGIQSSLEQHGFELHESTICRFLLIYKY